MKKSIRILTVILTLILILGILPNCKAIFARKESDIIREMIYTYSWHGANGMKRIDSMLNELQSSNEESADKWRQIIDYWNYANTELEPNINILPDNLSEAKELCIVVLGFALNPDGTMKDELLGRLAVALASAERYPNAYVLCTGGGTASENPDTTEADAMAAWLEDNGISRDRLIVENKSLDTAQNAQFSREILISQYPEVTDIAIVSSDYHISWGSLLFQAEFLLEGDSISVISNAAFPADAPKYPVVTFQRSGLLALAGISDWQFMF